MNFEDRTSTKELFIMVSKEIPSLFLDIDESQGSIEEMNNSEDKSKQCIGTANIIEENSVLENLGSMTMKGRGNSTWNYDKKPYQIKLDSKYNVLNMGKAKTWILLANVIDDTLVRNALGFDLANALELQYTNEYRFVDLYMNGEYQGNYILCEKNQINTNRVEITNLEDEVDDVLSAYKKYSGIKYETLSDMVNAGAAQLSEDKKKVVSSFGGKNYELDLTGGYLLEFDYYDDSIQMQFTNKKLTVKSPENLGKEIEDICYSYIVDYVKMADESILNSSGDNSSEIHYTEYIDIESFAKMWLIKEYSMDFDAGVSLYMYKDKNGKLYAGPVWDFDNAFWSSRFAYNSDMNYKVLENGGTYNSTECWLTNLMQHQEFINELKEQYKKYQNVFSNSYMANLADNHLKTIQSSSNMNYKIWEKNYRSDGTQVLKQFLNTRDKYMSNYINGLNTVKVDSQILENGIYTISTALNENKLLDVAGGNKNSEANIQIWDKANVANQKFQITYMGDGSYLIVALHSGKVLDVAGAGKTNGTNVWQYENNGSNAQKWILYHTGNGYYSIVSKSNGLYLDVSGANVSNGTNIQVYEGNGSKAQKFKLNAVKEQTIEEGTYTISTALDKNKVLDVAGGNEALGTNIQLWDQANVANQKFQVIYKGNGYYSLIASHSEKAMDVISGSLNAGANVQQYRNNGSDAQQWIIQDAGDGYYYLISKCNGLFLDVNSGQAYNGSNIQVYCGNGSNAQKFKFSKVGEKTIEDGIYTISTAVNQNKVLDVAGGNEASGANIQLWDQANVANQNFRVTYKGNGYYTLEAIHAKKVLDVAGGSQYSGANVQQYESNGTDAQKWLIQDAGDGYYYLISKCNGLYLDISGGNTANGTNVQVYAGNGTAAQKFKFSTLASKTIEDGTYTISTATDANKVLDIAAGSKMLGGNVQIWSKANVQNQTFNVKNLGNGYYTIEAAHSGYVLDVAGASNQNGTNVQQYASNETDAQQWIIQEAGNGYYYLISKCNGLYLDVSGGCTANGTNVNVYKGNGTSAQKFKFNEK